MAEAQAKDHKDEKKASAAKIARNAQEEEDGPGAAPAPAMKQRILATALSRAIVISTLIGSVAIATATLLSARYELVRGPNTDNNFVYRLDRLTGDVRFCGQQQCTDVGVTSK